MKVLLITLQGIGNTILALPIFQALKTRGWLVDLIVSDNGSSEIVRWPALAHTLLPWRENQSGFRNLASLGAYLRSTCYDKAFALCPAGKRENILLRLARAREKQGWRAAAGLELLAFRNPQMMFWNEREHDLNSNSLLTNIDSEELSLALSSIRTKLKSIANGKKKGAGGLRLGIHPFSRDRARCWPIENFQELLMGLHRKFPLEICVFGSSSEVEKIQSLISKLPFKVEMAAGWPWTDILRKVNDLDAFIGVDSALCHLAAVCGVPTCILFAFTVPERTSALGENVLIVQTDYPCCPCYQFASDYFDDCIHHLRCIRDLAVADVLEIATLFLERRGNAAENVCAYLKLPHRMKAMAFGAKLLNIAGRK